MRPKEGCLDGRTDGSTDLPVSRSRTCRVPPPPPLDPLLPSHPSPSTALFASSIVVQRGGDEKAKSDIAVTSKKEAGMGVQSDATRGPKVTN